jgi:transposase
LRGTFSEHRFDDVRKIAMHAWHRLVRRSAGRQQPPVFADMVRCAGMVERHLEGILAHWEGRAANARDLEGISSMSSTMKRKARGFRSAGNLAVMPCFHTASLTVPAFR